MGQAGVWVLGEHRDSQIERITFELMSRGLELVGESGAGLNVMVFGDDISQEQLQGIINRGAERVVAVEGAMLSNFTVEPYAASMLRVIEEYRPGVIIAGATSLGRTLMPYVAIKANTGLTADCTGLEIDAASGNLLQTRPAIGGNIMATIKTPNHRPQMATVRPRSTRPAEVIGEREGKIVRLKAADELCSRVVRTGFKKNEDEISLAEAEKVVVVGRGIKRAENLKLIYELAEKLGAAVGATRDVVDRGWLSYPHQVGLSGQTVSPRLYIGVGVSGAIQHLAGMQTAENIIAINNDPDAQIFKVADMGIVGDLFDVLPGLVEKLGKGGEL